MEYSLLGDATREEPLSNNSYPSYVYHRLVTQGRRMPYRK